MRPNSIKLIYLLLCVIIFSSLGWSQYYEKSYNYKSTYTDTIGPQWIHVPDASNEQGRENSLTLHNGLPFFVFKYKVDGYFISLAYAKYVGENNGNCGYEGSEGTVPVENFKCGFIEQGDFDYIVPLSIGDENSIISDGINVYVSYTHREGSGFQKLRFAEYVGEGNGNCGYDIELGSGEPSSEENSWNCKDASDTYSDLTSPQTLSVGGTPYVIYASDNSIHVSEITEDGYTNTNLEIVDSSEEITWISPEYSSDENKIYFAFATVDSNDPEIEYKLYYSYIDLSSDTSIYSVPTYVDTFTDGTGEKYIPIGNGDQVDTALSNNCNDGSAGICNLHILSSHISSDGGFSLRYNLAEVGISSDSPSFRLQDLSGLAGTTLGEVPSIEIDSEGLPHFFARRGDEPHLPLYVFKNPEGSEEDYTIVDNFEANDVWAGTHSSFKLDSTNRAHMIYIVDKDSHEGLSSSHRGWRIRYVSFKIGDDECGGTTQLDVCGVCGGNGYTDWACNDGASTCWNIVEGACDCDDNIDLGCGCNLPASLSYCIDTDSDSLGAGDSTYYCLADLPTGWVEDCSDLEPDCATNDTDECGECGGDGPAEGFDCDGGSLSLLNDLIPQDYSIHSVYPNPFNPITKITYGLPENTDTQITVFDIGGTHITTLVNTFQIAGYHTINWNASSYPSGVYLIRMDSGDFTQTQKVVLVK